MASPDSQRSIVDGGTCTKDITEHKCGTDTNSTTQNRRERQRSDPGVGRQEECMTDEANGLTEDPACNRVPVDTGWAWFILLGSVIIVTIIIGTLKSIGILFVEFQRKFDSSSSLTSLVATVQNAVYSIFALVVTTAGMKKISCRMLVIIGTIIVSASYIFTSQAEDMSNLFLSYGVLNGLGMACIQPCSLVMVGLYFDKRRGFANSVAISGGSLGGLIMAPLLTAMFEYYGYSGCFLILAAIVLNCFVSAMLFRSPSFYTSARRRGTRNNAMQRNENSIHLTESIKHVNTANSETFDALTSENTDTTRVNGPNFKTQRIKLTISNDASASASLLEIHQSNDVLNVSGRNLSFRERSNTEPSSKKLVNVLLDRQIRQRPSSEYLGVSMLDIPVVTLPANQEPSESPHKRPRSTCKWICEGLSSVFDFQLIKTPVFIMFITAAGLLCSSGAMTIVYLPPYATEQGVSKTRVATLLQVYSAIDICSRIALGYLSDRAPIRRSTMIGIGAIICGVFANLLQYFATYHWLMFYAVMLGLFSGVYFALFAAVIVDYLTVAKLRDSLGFTILSHGSSISATFAIMGYLRDVSGSYVLPYRFLGTTSFLGAALMFTMPVAERLHRRRAERRENK